MHLVRKVDGRVLWANLFLLFWLSLIPFVIRWIGEAKFSAEPVAAYGVVLTMAAIAYWLLERVIIIVDVAEEGEAPLEIAVGNGAARTSFDGRLPGRGGDRLLRAVDCGRYLHRVRRCCGSCPTGGSKRKSKKRSRPRATAASTLEAGTARSPHRRFKRERDEHGKLARHDDPRGQARRPHGDRRRRPGVSMGNTVMKPNAKKVRRLGAEGKVIGGFAGATADAFTLFERLEKKLEAHRGQLLRAAVELAKDWRTDKYLRNLEAMMIVADAETMLILTGNGDVLEPEGGIAAIGSGGNYALAAAKALADYETDPEKLARRAMAIAAEVCVFTNDRLTVERGE